MKHIDEIKVENAKETREERVCRKVFDVMRHYITDALAKLLAKVLAKELGGDAETILERYYYE